MPVNVMVFHPEVSVIVCVTFGVVLGVDTASIPGTKTPNLTDIPTIEAFVPPT